MLNNPYNQPNYYGQNPIYSQNRYLPQNNNSFDPNRFMPSVAQPTTDTNNVVSRVLTVSSMQEAQNAQLPMDGSITYFVLGDKILARNWSFATGKIENKLYNLANEEVVEEKKVDRLDAIEEKLDKLLSQASTPTSTPKAKKETSKDE